MWGGGEGEERRGGRQKEEDWKRDDGGSLARFFLLRMQWFGKTFVSPAQRTMKARRLTEEAEEELEEIRRGGRGRA